MLGGAKAKKSNNAGSDEESKRKFGIVRKPRAQGWFKSSSEQTQSQSSISNSSNGSGSGSGTKSHSHTSPTEGTTPTTQRSSPAYIDAECVPVSPGMGGMPPREVNVENDLVESLRSRASQDEISVLSSSVVQHFSPHSPASMGSGSGGSNPTQNQIVDALISGMENDRMADVTLLGRDGAKVRAAKFVLACRSPALQEKLYQDPTKVEVYIGEYGEDAILAMKEYCQTGGIKSSALVTTKSHETARGLVELASLAKVYGFEPLYGEADSILYQLINASPWFATACYDSAGSETKLIEEFLLQFIKTRCPDLLLETNALKSVGQQRLLVLLDGLECTDSEMLKYLEKWIELKGATRENVNFLRATAARKLSLVRLLEDPSMVSHVRSSGIFDRYMVESIINASPIMEEEEEEDDDDEEEDDDEDDEDDEDGLEAYCSSISTPRDTRPDLSAELSSPQGSSPLSKEGKKKKKKDKEKKEKKEKKDKKEKEKKKKHKKSSKSKSAESSVSAEDSSHEHQDAIESG